MARRFSGFTPATLEFFADVARNNDRAWYQENRERYLEDVVAPAQAFVLELGERLQKLRPEVGFDPNPNGRGSIKKIHTDTRFQKDRDPLKTYCQIIFWEGPLKTKKANSVFLVHFEPGKLALAAGLKYFDGKLLKPFREALVHQRKGTDLRRVVDELAAVRGYEICGAHYKNVPRGFDAAHKNADLLRHDALYVSMTKKVPASFYSARLLSYCEKHFAKMAALHSWCVDFLEAAVAKV